MKHLILASGSPRRRELLSLFGVPFSVHAADIDETMDPAKPPYDEVARVSSCTALAIPRQPGDVVIAADTVVAIDGRVLGKPKTAEQAEEMLSALSGRTHAVYTGVTLWKDGEVLTEHEETQVTFRPLAAREIRAYVATGEPMDKAGAYGIQGRGALLVERIAGDYCNVVGLPLCRLGRMLSALGLDPWNEEGRR